VQRRRSTLLSVAAVTAAFPMHAAPASPVFGVPGVAPDRHDRRLSHGLAWATRCPTPTHFESGKLQATPSPNSPAVSGPTSVNRGTGRRCARFRSRSGWASWQGEQQRVDHRSGARVNGKGVVTSRARGTVAVTLAGATRTDTGNWHVAVPPGVLVPGRRKGRL
jgi:hypothetical protein